MSRDINNSIAEENKIIRSRLALLDLLGKRTSLPRVPGGTVPPPTFFFFEPRFTGAHRPRLLRAHHRLVGSTLGEHRCKRVGDDTRYRITRVGRYLRSPTSTSSGALEVEQRRPHDSVSAPSGL